MADNGDDDDEERVSPEAFHEDFHDGGVLRVGDANRLT